MIRASKDGVKNDLAAGRSPNANARARSPCLSYLRRQRQNLMADCADPSRVVSGGRRTPCLRRVEKLRRGSRPSSPSRRSRSLGATPVKGSILPPNGIWPKSTRTTARTIRSNTPKPAASTAAADGSRTAVSRASLSSRPLSARLSIGERPGPHPLEGDTMPLVRIDLREGKDATYRQELGRSSMRRWSASACRRTTSSG